jgi:hypothetical protein
MRSPLIPAWVSAFFTASAACTQHHVVFDRATLVAASFDREADVEVLLQKLRVGLQRALLVGLDIVLAIFEEGVLYVL